jgi:pilus assembly protein CpaE
MSPRRQTRESELNAILIAPNRDLAELFLATVPKVRGFQVLGDIRNYPSRQTLEIRLRQLRPEVALLDLATSLEEAGEVIRYLSSLEPPVQVVGLHTQNDSEVLLGAVRMGASEFLYAPFDPSMQLEALARLRKLRQPEASVESDFGKVIMFASAKPGSGASTLATQTAFALKRTTGRRVLLADCDLGGGSIGFLLKLGQKHSLVNAIENPALDVAAWSDYVVTCGGVDILTGPEAPYVMPVDPARFQDLVQFMRSLYDWIVLDMPSIFHRISLMGLSEAERAFLVSTSELPSLHLTRKASSLLSQLGFGRERFQVLVNRVNKRDGLGGAEIGRLFDCQVHSSYPNDYFSLHRVITLGRPLTSDCELGKAIENLASKLTAASEAEKKKPGGALNAKPALSET